MELTMEDIDDGNCFVDCQVNQSEKQKPKNQICQLLASQQDEQGIFLKNTLLSILKSNHFKRSKPALIRLDEVRNLFLIYIYVHR